MPQPQTKPLRYRQIHLDFHTSEHIKGVGAKFDAADFAGTLKAANVDLITVFAKCHHGWSYYPTKVGAPHPYLARPDLLGDMLTALKAADIEAPVYISVQWDERTAREHPEWRVMSATNMYQHALPSDPSSGKALSPGWHTVCLAHAPYRKYVLDQAREVMQRYSPPGLFFDIILTPGCVCSACIGRMQASGLDPESADDRLANDEAVNEQFRQETSRALQDEFPGVRIFYNCGHIHKQGPERFAPYTHLELESLPTGGWGYDHFPSSARYAATLGLDYVAHTGKFHTSWGEFGGFKNPQALTYECGQMVALGSKCLVGDQLHPDGAINHDTYASIAPAYERVAKLEPYLKGARQASEIAILSAEHFHPVGARNSASDDGAAQMLLELKQLFDVVDSTAKFEAYRLLILPDEIPVEGAFAERLKAYVAGGGKIIASWRSGLDSKGALALDAGIRRSPQPAPFRPVYVSADPSLDPDMTATPFVVYEAADVVTAAGATVLGQLIPSYFNRTYAHFCSHQHTPDDPTAAPLGAAVTEHNGVAYIAFPVFRLYHAVGQPLYKYIVRGLINRLMPEPAVTTSLPSSGRVALNAQAGENRHILHLLYGAPQVRGKAIPLDNGSTRVMEMIEDIPALASVEASVKLPGRPKRVFEALTGQEVAWRQAPNGRIAIALPSVHIHAAVVFEGSE